MISSVNENTRAGKPNSSYLLPRTRASPSSTLFRLMFFQFSLKAANLIDAVPIVDKRASCLGLMSSLTNEIVSVGGIWCRCSTDEIFTDRVSEYKRCWFLRIYGADGL